MRQAGLDEQLRAINTARAYINNPLPGQLSTLYAAIRAKAPNARVVAARRAGIDLDEFIARG